MKNQRYRTLLIKTRLGNYLIAPWIRGADGVVQLQDDPIEIQSLVFSKDAGWTAEKAVEWAGEHDFKNDKVDEPEGGNTVRLRQFEPSECKPDSYASWPMEGVEGVTAVGCRKQGSEQAAFPYREARTLPGIVRAADEAAPDAADNDVDGVASMSTIDRYQEVIRADAYTKSIEGFKEHPVMLLGHESEASVELPIGNWRRYAELKDDSLRVGGSLLKEHRRYSEVQASVRERNLALSVGFIPLRGHEATEEDIAQYGAGVRYVWDEVELLEVSLVSIPANRQSLLAMKSAAVREAERTLEMGSWAETVRELKALDARTSAIRRRIRAGEVKNWKPLVDEIKKVTNDFTVAFSEKVGALEEYLADQLGEGEPAPEGDEPAGPEGEPPTEGANQDAVEALRSLENLTRDVAGRN